MSVESPRAATEGTAIRRPLAADGWTVLATLGGVLVGAGLALSGELVALVAAPVALVAAVGLATPFALAACVVLVGVLAAGSPQAVLVAGGGLFAVAGAGLEGVPNPFAGIAVLALVTALLVGVAGGAWIVWPPWLATVGVLVAIALLGYASHRYERVLLGLVGDDTEDER